MRVKSQRLPEVYFKEMTVDLLLPHRPLTEHLSVPGSTLGLAEQAMPASTQELYFCGGDGHQ